MIVDTIAMNEAFWMTSNEKDRSFHKVIYHHLAGVPEEFHKMSM
jgi:hypothetical protein